MFNENCERRGTRGGRSNFQDGVNRGNLAQAISATSPLVKLQLYYERARVGYSQRP